MGANGACEAVTNALIKHTETSMVVTIAATRALGMMTMHNEILQHLQPKTSIPDNLFL